MKSFSAAIPLVQSRLTGPGREQLVLALMSLVGQLEEQGFDEIVLLPIYEELPQRREFVESFSTLVEDRAFKCVIPRGVYTRGEFLLESALEHTRSDWVFLFQLGERLEGVAQDDDRLCHQLKDSKAGFAVLTDTKGQAHQRGLQRGINLMGSEQIGHLTLNSSIAVEFHDHSAAPRSPEYDLTVILPTWRLGGLDVTLGALAKQTLDHSKFEVIVVDALAQWRQPLLFPPSLHIRHLPIENSIFPVSSHSRFRNTAIRAAQGKRLVFLSDYCAPPPEFLELHARLPEDTIGLTPYIRTPMDPETVVCKHDSKFERGLSVWDVIESAHRGEFLWSTFKVGVDPVAAAVTYEKRTGKVWPAHMGPLKEKIARDDEQASPGQSIHRPMAGEDIDKYAEFWAHWKTDSVPAKYVHLINGWDETYDGNGGYADVDFNLRLLWAGVKQRLVETKEPVRILDGHEISVAPVRDLTRNNWQRLCALRRRKTIRCLYGLTHGAVNEG